ncbi:unnamed protein product [Arctia plantaginis]|uniref:Uncharacterized protein n=1 Tax=Arctia plantaginis TaxID=874455 RepID=A0A8S0Z7X2_ARCPL|nr:unnamed protein product [Arctia plantaginis]
MSVTRSPTKAAGAPSLTSSQPDLSKCELPVIDNFVFTRKRKQPDADVEVKEAIAELRKDMMSFLYEFKSSQKAEFQQVRSDVTDVKNQLESIKVANNDIIRDHNQFRKDLSSLTDSLDFQSKEQDDLKFRMNIITTKTDKITSLESELTIVKRQLTTLQMEQNIREQRERAASRPVKKTLNFNMFVLRPKKGASDRIFVTTDGVSRFGPILEMFVQYFQGLLSVKLPQDNSLSVPKKAGVPVGNTAENEVDSLQELRMPGIVVRPSRTKPGTYEVEIDMVVDDGQPDEKTQ